VVARATCRSAGSGLHPLFENAKVTAGVRTPEFVVLKAAAPNGWPASHDVERGTQSVPACRIPAPRLRHAGEFFSVDTENPVNPAFGLAPMPVAPSSRISPPEPGAAPGKGEDGGRVIVGLDLHQDIDRFR